MQNRAVFPSLGPGIVCMHRTGRALKGRIVLMTIQSF